MRQPEAVTLAKGSLIIIIIAGLFISPLCCAGLGAPAPFHSCSFAQPASLYKWCSVPNQSHKKQLCLHCSAPPLSCSPSNPTALKLSDSAAVPLREISAYETSQPVTQPVDCRLDNLVVYHAVIRFFITLSNWSPFYSCLANYCLSFAKCEGLHTKQHSQTSNRCMCTLWGGWSYYWTCSVKPEERPLRIEYKLP